MKINKDKKEVRKGIERGQGYTSDAYNSLQWIRGWKKNT